MNSLPAFIALLLPCSIVLAEWSPSMLYVWISVYMNIEINIYMYYVSEYERWDRKCGLFLVEQVLRDGDRDGGK